MNDYHEYVIKDGKFIGKFDEMYRDIEDPWNLGDTKQPQYNKVLEFIKKYSERPICILDVGCGLGTFTNRIKGVFPKAYVAGIDISREAVARAGKRYSHISFFKEDIAKLKFEMGTFDVVVVSSVFWYVLPNIHTAIRNIFGSASELVVINQNFYKTGQNYGKEIMRTPDDLLKMIPYKPAEEETIDHGNAFSKIWAFRLRE